ncbi:bifunctional pantoate--beta-alanine ligase/(d)CMP kinase [Cyanobium sp. HWJ4-Hawea]|uniref:bifunctional pantoate--beta-alanine ligase/(d)CMP kinase n=1 Tax=Cyanobium sp. HWJ4-Hawea TaxID=2823713 RepID=UPI0020CBEFB7|nr:bifunctional pantoate--beta-alanine ligase/(d)CMP kinase [Cyanobium sp. HWJ4-Hawea]MCP9809781.1 bifunctional pantoate--beta-alanine ligase/(d)CMP kinase [Cyanobium sp. HWJ4-Hawea]
MALQLLQSCSDLALWRQQQPGPVHFVPTMGALHQGHLRLFCRATELRGAGQPAVLASIFVNPSQFGPGEDFSRYPRDLAADLAVAEQGCVAAVFAPSVAEIYPKGVEELTAIQPAASLQEVLCGRSRPGHFNGVATVVTRLLQLVRPDRLVMGEKDWQQLIILRRVASDLGFQAWIEGCATVREDHGLACSSRNRYLEPGQMEQAWALPGALAAAAGAIKAQDQTQAKDPLSAKSLIAGVRQRLEAAGLAVEYVELVSAHNLRPLTALAGVGLLAAAVHCGSSRLIDHTFLMSRSPIVAIDGPAGAGKSTVTKAFAKRLGLIYLDTGSMYRALTWWVQQQGVDPADGQAVAPLLVDLDLRLTTAAGGEQQVRINGHEVTDAIRSPGVTAQVSLVAAHGCVRAALTSQQQAMGQRGGLVAEGRDIGTAVFPDAELKVFLTATTIERARRRAADLQQRGFAVPPLEELEQQIAERDHLDSTRAVAPLCQAADAIELVTDGMEIGAVIQALVDLFRDRVPEEAWPAPN